MNKVNVDASVLLSVATRPDQVESINSWISGICKDYPGIIPLGAMHPEHPDPEAKSMWMRQPGIKGIRLHGQLPCFGKTVHQDDARNLIFQQV